MTRPTLNHSSFTWHADQRHLGGHRSSAGQRHRKAKPPLLEGQKVGTKDVRDKWQKLGIGVTRGVVSLRSVWKSTSFLTSDRP